MPSKIEWTDETWNPVRGCSIVSEGCRNCYAMRMAHRFPQVYGGLTRLSPSGPVWTGKVRTVSDKLEQPLRWKRPRRVFVNSMSDLFHDSVPDHFIAAVFLVMSRAPQHTFQILTKRPERMHAWMAAAEAPFNISWLGWARKEYEQLAAKDGEPEPEWPLRNVWLGVSVEDQKTAEERIPLLLQTPAAIRWISAEPLLSHLTFNRYEIWDPRQHGMYLENIHWVVVGGESGPGARPMNAAWAQSIRDECNAAKVPFLFKQWGAWEPTWCQPLDSKAHTWNDGNMARRVGKKAAGRELDGRTWDQYPEVQNASAH